MTGPYGQAGFRVRFDWGAHGAETINVGAEIVAVIDVLSFTTTLTVAADNGVEVFPYPFGDESAQAFARRHDAVLAVGRDQARQSGGVSLSAATVRAAEDLRRLVLPSPNGSAIAQKMSAAGAVVLGVSLRNVEAAVSWATTQLLERPEIALAVVAAGERWPDGSLRPAVEDLWGAGAFLAGLVRRRELPFAPEATAAAAAYVDVSGRLPELVWESVSGRELRKYGYSEDVKIATEVNASSSVPVLAGDRFTRVSAG